MGSFVQYSWSLLYSCRSCYFDECIFLHCERWCVLFSLINVNGFVEKSFFLELLHIFDQDNSKHSFWGYLKKLPKGSYWLFFPQLLYMTQLFRLFLVQLLFFSVNMSCPCGTLLYYTNALFSPNVWKSQELQINIHILFLLLCTPLKSRGFNCDLFIEKLSSLKLNI